MTALERPAATLVPLGLLLLHFGAAPAAAQSRGCQLIGMSRASASDVGNLSSILLNAGGPLHVSLLPFEFNPEKPFDNASTLVQSVTPGLNGSLHVSLYLKWFPHDAPGLREQDEFWSAWESGRPSDSQTRTREDFLRRVQQADAWVAGTAAWASRNGTARKFGATLVPVLEDSCKSPTAYRNLLAAVRRRQALDGVSTTLRRSCLTGPQHAFGLEVPLELHGRWDDVQDRLGTGDLWSNDGTDYSVDDFTRDQRKAIERGVHVLYWNASYNGGPKQRDNWAERVVDPFSRPSANQRRALPEVLEAGGRPRTAPDRDRRPDS